MVLEKYLKCSKNMIDNHINVNTLNIYNVFSAAFYESITLQYSSNLRGKNRSHIYNQIDYKTLMIFYKFVIFFKF